MAGENRKGHGKAARDSPPVIRTEDGRVTAVSWEVYREYHRMRRREMYQEEQKRKYGMVSLDAAGYDMGAAFGGSAAKQSCVEDALLSEWYVRKLYEGIDALDAWDRRLVGLLYFAGMTVKDTAGALGCSRGKVYAHRKKLLAALRGRFEAEGVHEYAL
ncbi:MAG: sigma-70 family RNA polymerase sigma factor [Lachnospiraceae bacterium]|nr:sigma-70 family RNA polymerase sigma factor [Lachnospiraceae bacterium]